MTIPKEKAFHITHQLFYFFNIVVLNGIEIFLQLKAISDFNIIKTVRHFNPIPRLVKTEIICYIRYCLVSLGITIEDEGYQSMNSNISSMFHKHINTCSIAIPCRPVNHGISLRVIGIDIALCAVQKTIQHFRVSMRLTHLFHNGVLKRRLPIRESAPHAPTFNSNGMLTVSAIK